MTTTKVEIDIPEGIAQYTVPQNKEEWNTRNAMLVYPYIRKGIISYGKAAEMIGLRTMEPIMLYGKFS